MAVIDTTTNEAPETIATTNIAPPSPGLAALLGNEPTEPDTTNEATTEKKQRAPKAKNPILQALEDKAKAAAEAKKQAEAEAKKIAEEKKAAAAALKADKEAQKANREAEKAAKAQAKLDAKAAKEAEKAAKKAEAEARREAAKNALPDTSSLPAVEVKGLNDTQVKTILEGKASAALKIAWTSELNGELAYKKLAERYGYSIKPLVEALVEEKLWPVQEDGTPWGYQKVYKAEKENSLKSFGHMVNRSAERFSSLNPANIEKREKAKAEAEAKRKELAALEAAGLAKKAATTTTTIKSSETDFSALSAEDLLKTAKACILAMDKNALAILEADPEVKEAFGWFD